MEYLIKVSAVIVIFYFCYNLFLQRDTFFEQNRWFLLLGLLVAFLIPYFVIPNYIEYTPIVASTTNDYTAVVTKPIEEPFTIKDYLFLIYILGILCFTIRFVIQLTSLSLIILKNKKEKNGYYTYIKTKKNISPFSFFKWIVFNPNKFTEKELEQIITHEKVHVNQYHSIDILLTQLTCIVLWFNPFIWLYNKNLKQNLEFIADKNAQSKVVCKKSYQTTLLKTSIPSHQMVLSNNFYNSLIKKRIVMLHKSKSKKINLLKYVLVIPLLALFLMSFNTKNIYIEKEVSAIETPTIASTINENISESLLDGSLPLIDEEKIAKKTQTGKPILNSTIKKSTKKPFQIIQEKTEFLINKKTTGNSLEKIKALLKKQGFSAQFKGLKRNSEGEITAIKIKVSSGDSNANYNISSNTPINPIVVLITDDGKNISIGNQTIVENEFIITGRVSDDNGRFLPGTTIIVKDTEKGTISNFDGEYKIKVKKGDELSFEFIGFDTKVLEVKGDDELNVKLKEQQGKDKKFKAKLSSVKYEDSTKIIIKTDNGKEPVYIINGKVLTKEEIKEISPDLIKSVSVIKGEKAKAIYGDKGENGVVIIEKKGKSEFIVNTDYDEDDREVLIIKEDKDSSNIVIRSTRSKDGPKPLITIDGEEQKDKELNDFNPDDIGEINVLKGESAIEKYGTKGKNGVIEITTKKKQASSKS